MGYIVGLAKNHEGWGWRQSFMEQAQADYQAQQQKQRLFGEDGGRDVGQSGNPRFAVKNLEGEAQKLYDELYCARGEMENRI